MDQGYEAAWAAAKEDAGLAETTVHLYPFSEAPADDGYTAMFWDPGSFPFGKDGPPLTDNQRKHALAHLADYQIAIHIDLPVTAFGAKVRHELEHVSQSLRWGRTPFELQRAIIVLQSRLFEHRRGTGHLFNVVPVEHDANRAAATFARRYFGEEAADALLDTDEAVLLRPGVTPEPIDTLGERMLAFASVYAPELEVALEKEIHKTAREFLGPLVEDVDRKWTMLANDAEVRRLADEASRARPSQEGIDAAERNVGPLWAPTQRLTIQAADRARALLGLPATPT
jgi:hypothetical protein